VDENLVMPPPPDDIINKRAYPASDYLGGGVYRVGMGAVGPGAALKANLIVEFFLILPLKI